MNEASKYVAAKSFFGFGTTLYGWRSAPNGGHIVTRWITLAFFPIVPIRSYAIDFTDDGRSAFDYVLEMVGFVRDVLGGQPTSSICWQQVINTYLYVYLPWAIAISVGQVFGPMVPEFVSWFVCWLMAALILASWFFAAVMMRRAFRARIVRS